MPTSINPELLSPVQLERAIVYNRRELPAGVPADRFAVVVASFQYRLGHRVDGMLGPQTMRVIAREVLLAAGLDG